MQINDQIATLLAAIIALGLALRAGVGPVVMYLTEAIKDAFKLPDGWGGLMSVIVGIIVGVTLGGLSAAVTTDSDIGVFMAFGALGGLFMAAGAIETHKAAGQVNPEAGAAVNVESADTVAAVATNGQTPANVAEWLPVARDSDYFEDYPESNGILRSYSTGIYSTEDAIEGEDGSSEPVSDWLSFREAGGHTGEAIEAEPIEGVPEPTVDYRGDGPPPAETDK